MTDWIGAVAGVLTVVAAVAAGAFAARAAHWTKKQAKAAARQVDIAKKQLAVAQREAEQARTLIDEQRRHAARAARRVAEDRVDARMPTVLIRATPGAEGDSLLQYLAGGTAVMELDQAGQEFSSDELEGKAFLLNVTFHLENTSDQVARVVLVDPAGGELSLSGSDGVVVRPGQVEAFRWTRRISASSLRTPEDLHEQTGNVRARLWVRDLGFNAYDEVDLVLNLDVFTRDGSRLLVSHRSLSLWKESVGTLLPERVYDRLDAAPGNEAD